MTTAATVFGTWHATCDSGAGKHSVPSTFRMYPITAAFEKNPEKLKAVSIATGVKFALVRPCVSLRPVSADKSVENSFATSLRQPAPSLGTVTVVLITKLGSTVYSTQQPSFSSITVQDVMVEGVRKKDGEKLETYCWSERPVLPVDYRSGEMIYIPENLSSEACFGEVDGRHRTSQAAARNDKFIEENWSKAGENLEMSELAYVHCQVMIAPSELLRKVQDSIAGDVIGKTLLKFGDHLRSYSCWLNVATNATVVDSPLSVLLSLLHRSSEVSRGKGRLSSTCTVQIDGSGSGSEQGEKRKAVTREFSKTEVSDVRYVCVDTMFGGDEAKKMQRAIFEIVTAWVRGAVRLDGCVVEHRCRFCTSDKEFVAGGMAVTRGIAALMPSDGWNGELSDLSVPFSTMRRCVPIVKLITAAAYRVEKVSDLFPPGGSKAKPALLRRAELSLITRDLASVIMSIAAVRLAPGARKPIPLPTIARALNIPLQSTSEAESRALPATLAMIGSAAAALVLADVAAALGLKSASALLEADVLCEGEKYVCQSQDNDADEQFANRFLTSCSGVVVTKAGKKDGPPLLFANEVTESVADAVRTHSKEGVLVLRRALPELRTLLASVVTGEHDGKLEEDAARCGKLVPSGMEAIRPDDFAHWLSDKVVDVLARSGNDGGSGDLKRRLQERLRVWSMEIGRGNGPLAAPMFAVACDEQLLDVAKARARRAAHDSDDDAEAMVEGGDSDSEEESEDVARQDVAAAPLAEARKDTSDKRPKVAGKTLWGKRPSAPVTYQKRRVARGKRHAAGAQRSEEAQDEVDEALPQTGSRADVPEKLQAGGKLLYEVIDVDDGDDDFYDMFEAADRPRATGLLKDLREMLEKKAGGEASVSASESISISAGDVGGGESQDSSDGDEEDGGSKARKTVPQPLTQNSRSSK
jgi:hypothetical protein